MKCQPIDFIQPENKKQVLAFYIDDSRRLRIRDDITNDVDAMALYNFAALYAQERSQKITAKAREEQIMRTLAA